MPEAAVPAAAIGWFAGPDKEEMAEYGYRLRIIEVGAGSCV